MGMMAAGKQMSRARARAVAAAAMLLSLASAPVLAQGHSQAAILEDVRDFGSDPDSDGLFEYLVLLVPVNIGQADFYTIKAQLSVPGPAPASPTAQQKLFLDVGEQSVNLAFAGSDLAQLGASQVLKFKIVLADSSQKTVDAKTYHSSGGYSGSQFESSPAPEVPQFTGVVHEVPEDLDSDGLFGYLNMTFEVRNLSTDKVEVAGTLNRTVQATGTLQSYSAADKTALAELRFDGEFIRGLGVPGPYNVTVRLVLGPGNEVSARHATLPYNCTDFESPRPPVSFTGNGTDGGIDLDGDGLFDVLQISVEVDIELCDTYMFRASMPLPERYQALQDQIPRPSASVDFSAKGAYLVTFNFSGQVLRTLQLDGPYNVSLESFSERVLFIANGTYLTAPYRSAQFPLPHLPARFAGPGQAQAQDGDLDGLADTLTVTVPVETTCLGIFRITGVLYAQDHYLTSSGRQLELGIGRCNLSLGFDGRAIRQGGFDGPYTAILYLGAVVCDGPSLWAYLPPDRLAVRTGDIRADDFDGPASTKRPQTPPAEPEVQIGEQAYLGRAPLITAEVNKSAPDISFYYTLDDGKSARFRLVFTQLVAFSDSNSNGVLDPGEERFLAPLAAADWDASSVEFAGGPGGRVLCYNLSALLDLSAVGPQAGEDRPQARIPQWGRLTFSFTIAGLDLNFTSPVAFSLQGGAEMKIDIIIEPLRGLGGGITGLALQHYLSDESGRNYFRTYEPGQIREFKPGSAVVNGSIPGTGPVAQQKISLVGSGKEHGYYSWIPRALVEMSDGSYSFMPVNISYSTDGSQMELVLNYPLPAGTVSLIHDPTVGMNATNAPVQSAAIPRILFNPWLYIIAIGAAVAVVVVIRRGQRNGE